MSSLLLPPARTITTELVEPAYLHVPERIGSFGEEACDLVGLAGREVDPEQRLAIDAKLSYGPGGKWVSLSTGLLESRQNGKTAAVEVPVVMFDLFELPADRIVWTAQLFNTSLGAFKDILNLIDAAPELSRKVLKVSNSHGEEGIYLKSGAALEFRAREGVKSGRGLGGKRVVFDEALIIARGLIGALVPTLSARNNPALDYVSSACLEGPESDQLRSIVQRGRSANPGELVYVEFCAPGGFGVNACALGKECTHGKILDADHFIPPPPGCQYPLCELGLDCPHTPNAPNCVLDNRALLQLANHSAGRERLDGSGISWRFLANERQEFKGDPRELCRERLGWHDNPPELGGGTAIDMTRWSELEDQMIPAPDLYTQVAIGVDVTPKRDMTSISVAYNHAYPVSDKHPDGLTVTVVLLYELLGTDTAVAEVAKLMEDLDVVQLSIQAGGPAGSLIKPLNKVGKEAWPEWEVHAATGQEVAQGVGLWLDGMTNKTLRHVGQDGFKKALKAVTVRKYGEAKMWERSDLTNISPVFAGTLAINSLFSEGDDTGPNIY